MTSAEVLPRLQQRAVEADQIISELKAQLHHLKQASAASISAASAAEVERVTEENAVLRQEVERLKQELISAELQHGVRQVALPNSTLSQSVSNTASSTTSLSASTAAAVSASTVYCDEQTAVGKRPLSGTTTQTSTSSDVTLTAGSDDTPSTKHTATGESKKSSKTDKKQDPVKSAAAAAGESVDVSRLNMRIGRIVHVEKHPDADSLYVERVDVGDTNTRTVVSGLVKHVPLEQMENRVAVFLVNLKPVKMRGIMSEGMIMCASSPDKVEVIVPPATVEIGDRVTVEGYPGEADDQLNAKKKIWEQIQPDLRIDADGIATYKGAVWKVEGKDGLFRAHSVTNSAVK